MRFYKLDISLKSAMEKFIAILCDMYKMLPENIKKDVCLFFNRHRGFLLTSFGLRGACPLEIGCKRYIHGFCTCVCQNRSLETLKQFVDQLQTISYNMNKREDRLALVNYLDEFGANIFNKNYIVFI